MLHFKAVSKTSFRKTADVLLCIFGFVVMVYTTSLTVISWASGDAEPELPGYCDKQQLNLGGLF